jgi:hypothetical protein
MKGAAAAVATAHLAALQAHMEETAAKLGVKPVTVVLSDLEKRAARMIPRPTPRVKAEGYKGYAKFIEQIPKEERDNYPYSQFGTGETIANVSELNCLINGTHSVLDIKKMLDAQNPRKSSLQQVINYVQVLKLAGLVVFKEGK